MYWEKYWVDVEEETNRFLDWVDAWNLEHASEDKHIKPVLNISSIGLELSTMVEVPGDDMFEDEPPDFWEGFDYARVIVGMQMMWIDGKVNDRFDVTHDT